MTRIYFARPEDAAEILEALSAENYSVEPLRETTQGEDGATEHGWVLAVEPSDEHVIDMVDVYGGWLPGDEQLPSV